MNMIVVRGRVMAGWRHGLGVLIAGALACGLSSTAIAAESASAPSVAGDESAAIARAQAHLDAWMGRPEELQAARTELDTVLAKNPAAVEAYVQYARYFIDSGMINSRQYDPAKLVLAEKSLDHAIALSPNYAPAFVLRGSLYKLQKRPADAKASLQRARSLGSDSPWLALNEAELFLDETKFADALSMCRAVAKRGNVSDHVLDAAEGCMRDALRGLGHDDEVDALYRATIKRHPQHPWIRGNYANYLLCAMDKPQAAIEYAQSALELMDYGMARTTLAAALYADWAEKVRKGRASEAERAWDKAVRYAPGDPAQITGTVCSLWATMPLLYTLRDTRRAQLIPPKLAVLLAADAEDEGAAGVFGIDVVATGRDRGGVYLNSEADYRDQRNLTIAFTPKAAAVYRKLHGEDPDAALKGKKITVVGAARRVRIDFLHGGMPTGKFYYQTHVIVTDPKQVAIYDPNAEAPDSLPLPTGTDA
ncbi:tetratricopeptide repeat protein [Lysobacter terrae]